jgi:hypothetical protein
LAGFASERRRADVGRIIRDARGGNLTVRAEAEEAAEVRRIRLALGMVDATSEPTVLEQAGAELLAEFHHNTHALAQMGEAWLEAHRR